MKIWLPRRALVAILAEAQASADGRETGGILAGFEIDTGLVVNAAGPPGENAIRRRDFFLRDLETAEQLLVREFDDHGAVWIGDWHTHTIGDGRPSSTDATSYMRLLNDPELQFSTFLSLIVTSRSGRFTDIEITPWLAATRGIRRGQIELS
jgi:integrative and conjugative element protein (TIGR02256 family)